MSDRYEICAAVERFCRDLHDACMSGNRKNVADVLAAARKEFMRGERSPMDIGCWIGALTMEAMTCHDELRLILRDELRVWKEHLRRDATPSPV